MQLIKNLCEEIKKVEAAIKEAERELLQKAPEDIKTLYLKIDFLCCREKILNEELLLKSHTQ